MIDFFTISIVFRVLNDVKKKKRRERKRERGIIESRDYFFSFFLNYYIVGSNSNRSVKR